MHKKQYKSKTDLRIDYWERSKDFEYPESIEDALEDDYVLNSECYPDGIFEYIDMWCGIHPKISPSDMIEEIRNFKSA